MAHIGQIVCDDRLLLTSVRVFSLASLALGQAWHWLAPDWEQDYTVGPLLKTRVQASRPGT